MPKIRSSKFDIRSQKSLLFLQSRNDSAHLGKESKPWVTYQTVESKSLPRTTEVAWRRSCKREFLGVGESQFNKRYKMELKVRYTEEIFKTDISTQLKRSKMSD